MYISIKIASIFLSVFFLNGCAQAMDEILSPPADTKWVNVEVKNPSQYTKPFPLEVRYISYECMKKRISGFDGSVITEPSYNVIGIPMQQESGDIWKAKVAMIGGGSCKWTLSAVNLGIEYIDATHLGKDLVPGTAVGVSLAFDNDASRNGQYRIVKGDLNLSPKYYPYIIEWRLLSNENELTLLGKEDFLSYRVIDVDSILFEPLLDERKVIRYIEPEKKVDGVYSRIIYPDGSVAPERTLFPDFDKVDKMKIN
ncbi:hypothetical protein [Citrobacter braakii]|uniref:hypothetical protein n=1 Tax=Citrobacter braakii TaxID=57706 RepID=UPI001C6A54D9|nr:hypothetical protein [Citrobacter braakii]MDV0580905.1 hypothetical protein [Citrobacter braakii]MEB0652608.1 hypothetical protein [Citrobacter braakii]QYO49741.1 hypothetical protein K1552_14315 [Citrobacter braakii]HCQ0107471.1 hypothetical protein [Citrobacter braakii]